MRPNEQREALGAPGSNDSGQCRRCLTELDPGTTRCPRCGYPVHQLEIVENDDFAIQQMLTQANVLRLRQDYGEATKVCLDLLHGHPDNVDAHVLLGDVYRDRGQNDHAAQWYELALELDQEHGAAQDRLRNLPKDTDIDPKFAVPQRMPFRFVLLIIGIIVVFAVLALYVGNEDRKRQVRPTIVAPISARGSAKTHPPTASVATAPIQVESDRLLKEALQPLAHGDRVLAAHVDPRNSHLTATYSLDGDVNRAEIADIAKSILDARADIQSLTLRLARPSDGGYLLAYLADARRARLEETRVADGEGLANALLENEWNAASQP